MQDTGKNDQNLHNEDGSGNEIECEGKVSNARHERYNSFVEIQKTKLSYSKTHRFHNSYTAKQSSWKKKTIINHYHDYQLFINVFQI